MKSRHNLSFLSGCILVLSLIWLTSCGGTSNPTATSAPTSLPTTDTSSSSNKVIIPQITCTEALQLIAEKHIVEVQIYYEPPMYSLPSLLSNIEMIANTGESSSYDIFPLKATCEAQIVAKVHQVNKDLPKNQQILLKYYMTPSQS